MLWWLKFGYSFLLIFWMSLVSTAQTIGFTELSDQFGINYGHPTQHQYGKGLSLYDHNQDGLDDLTFGGIPGEPLHIFLNIGDSMIADPLIDPGLVDRNVACALWVDYDNDGDMDLSVNSTDGPPEVFRYSVGQLQAVSSLLGLNDNAISSYAATWTDLNNDGYLDYYSSNHLESTMTGSHNLLYQNNEGNTFTDISVPAGVTDGNGWGFGAVALDYDKDGWPDLYVANDRTFNRNVLFRNLGNNTFQNVSDTASTGMAMDGMGVAIGDPFNNGFEDIYVTNTPNINGDFPGNLFCENQQDGSFTERASDLGLSVNKVGWGCNWADFDNDADLDLFVSNTYSVNGDHPQKQNSLFINQGDGTFVKDSLSPLVLAYTRSYGSAVGDLNDDGYPDLAIMNEEPNRLGIWINDGGSNNWVKVTLQGVLSNRMGIGCWIELHNNTDVQYRYTRTGISYGSQDGRATIFGLGQASSIDSIIVRWPSGAINVLYGPAINMTHHIIENQVITQVPLISKTDLSIHPNPSSGIFGIEGVDEDDIILIHQADGRPLNNIEMSRSDTNAEIDLTGLKRGLYLVTVVSDMRRVTLRLVYH